MQSRPRISALRSAMSLGLLVAGTCVGAACQGAPAPSSPDVWAHVDGREIHRSEVERAYRNSVNPAAPSPSEDEALALKLDILDQLIIQNILAERARTFGLTVTDADVDAALAERRQAMTDEAFAQQLTASGLTLDEVKEGLRRELSVQRVIERDVKSKIAVTDEDIASYFDQNRAQFDVAERQFRLAQIVVTPERNPEVRNRMNDDAGTLAEAQRKMEMLGQRLEDGADFGELALDYSEDPQSLAQGGDLGYVPESSLAQLSPQLRDAVVAMDPGSVHAVNLGGTYMVLMLLAREEAGQRDLSMPAVKDGIRDMLTSRKEGLLQAAYVAAARDEAEIRNFLARQVVDASGKLTLPPSPLSSPAQN